MSPAVASGVLTKQDRINILNLPVIRRAMKLALAVLLEFAQMLVEGGETAPVSYLAGFVNGSATTARAAAAAPDPNHVLGPVAVAWTSIERAFAASVADDDCEEFIRRLGQGDLDWFCAQAARNLDRPDDPAFMAASAVFGVERGPAEA